MVPYFIIFFCLYGFQSIHQLDIRFTFIAQTAQERGYLFAHTCIGAICQIFYGCIVNGLELVAHIIQLCCRNCSCFYFFLDLCQFVFQGNRLFKFCLSSGCLNRSLIDHVFCNFTQGCGRIGFQCSNMVDIFEGIFPCLITFFFCVPWFPAIICCGKDRYFGRFRMLHRIEDDTFVFTAVDSGVQNGVVTTHDQTGFIVIVTWPVYPHIWITSCNTIRCYIIIEIVCKICSYLSPDCITGHDHMYLTVCRSIDTFQFRGRTISHIIIRAVKNIRLQIRISGVLQVGQPVCQVIEQFA